MQVREGRLQKLKTLKDSKVVDKFTEKGVDTLFTIDLLRLPKKLGIKTVIILTCDTDFVPAIEAVKEDGIKVILYYYANEETDTKFSMSRHLTGVCDESALLTKELLERAKFSKNTQSPS